MLVLDDADVPSASRKLLSAGFRSCTWSYGSVDPAFYQTDSMHRDVYKKIVHHYGHIDQNTVRFFLPAPADCYAKVVLMPSSYACIQPESISVGRSKEDNIVYPSSTVLVQSIVQVLVREPVDGLWASTLTVWAISYMYGMLMLSDDIMDTCDDKAARDWFDAKIRRYEGGLDRLRTKRFGRKGYDGP